MEDVPYRSQEQRPGLTLDLGVLLLKSVSPLECMPTLVPSWHLAYGTGPRNSLTSDYKADMQNSPGDKHCPLLSSPSQRQV